MIDYTTVGSALFGALRLRLAVEVTQDKGAPRLLYLPPPPAEATLHILQPLSVCKAKAGSHV